MAADKAFWANYGKPGNKSGGDLRLEETPSNPSELKQYIEVVGLFSEEIDSSDIAPIYQEIVNLLEQWEKECSGNEDLILAREKLTIVNKRLKKDKREIPMMLSISLEALYTSLYHLFFSPAGRNW